MAAPKTKIKIGVALLGIGLLCGCGHKDEVKTNPGPVEVKQRQSSLEQMIDSNPNLSAEQKAQEKAKLQAMPASQVGGVAAPK